MISIGFTIAFKMANDIATKKADKKSSTLTPGKSQAEISTANVERNILPKNCIFVSNINLLKMKTKNKPVLIWLIMFVVALSSNFMANGTYDGIRNVDIFKLMVIGFLAGGLVNELIHQFKAKAKE